MLLRRLPGSKPSSALATTPNGRIAVRELEGWRANSALYLSRRSRMYRGFRDVCGAQRVVSQLHVQA
jgi:hypothetical protein